MIVATPSESGEGKNQSQATTTNSLGKGSQHPLPVNFTTVRIPWPVVSYRIVLDTDSEEYGGHRRLDHSTVFNTFDEPWNNRPCHTYVSVCAHSDGISVPWWLNECCAVGLLALSWGDDGFPCLSLVQSTIHTGHQSVYGVCVCVRACVHACVSECVCVWEHFGKKSNSAGTNTLSLSLWCPWCVCVVPNMSAQN